MQTDAVSHVRIRCCHGLVCGVSIARRRLHLRMAEQFADQRGVSPRTRTLEAMVCVKSWMRIPSSPAHA